MVKQLGLARLEQYVHPPVLISQGLVTPEV